MCMCMCLCVILEPNKYIQGFPHGSYDKKSTCNMGNLGSVSGLGRSPGGGHGNPLQYSCLENPHEQEEPGRLQFMELQRIRHD